MDIEALRVKFTGTFKDLEKSAKSARKKIADFAKKVTKVGKTVAKVGAIMAGAFTAVGAAIFALTKKVANLGDKFDKMRQRVGVSAEFLSKLAFAADISGASIEAVEAGVRRLQRAAADAERGLETYKRAFDDLGISVKDQSGKLKSTERLFLEVLDALKGVTNETKRAALAQELLGRGGTQLLPLLQSDYRALMEEAKKLGITWTDETAAAAAKFNDELTRLKASLQGIAKSIALELMPKIEPVITKIKDWIVAHRELIATRIQDWIERFGEALKSFYEVFRDTIVKIGNWIDRNWAGYWSEFSSDVETGTSKAKTTLLGFDRWLDLWFARLSLKISMKIQEFFAWPRRPEEGGILSGLLGYKDMKKQVEALNEQMANIPADAFFSRMQRAVEQADKLQAEYSQIAAEINNTNLQLQAAQHPDILEGFQQVYTDLHADLKQFSKDWQALSDLRVKGKWDEEAAKKLEQLAARIQTKYKEILESARKFRRDLEAEMAGVAGAFDPNARHSPSLAEHLDNMTTALRGKLNAAAGIASRFADRIAESAAKSHAALRLMSTGAGFNTDMLAQLFQAANQAIMQSSLQAAGGASSFAMQGASPVNYNLTGVNIHLPTGSGKEQVDALIEEIERRAKFQAGLWNKKSNF